MGSCANTKRVVCSTTRIPPNLHIICRWVPLMCAEKLKINCEGSSDESRMNEYMSYMKGRALQRAVLLHQQLCPQKKKSSLLEM